MRFGAWDSSECRSVKSNFNAFGSRSTLVSFDEWHRRERRLLKENSEERGFATLHREEVIRRVVRRVAAVLDLSEFGDRLDLSGVPDCAAWESNVFELGWRQLGVYITRLESLTENEALDIIREGHVVIIPHKEGDFVGYVIRVGRSEKFMVLKRIWIATRDKYLEEDRLYRR